MAKRENGFQSELIKRIESRFPGSVVLKNDEQYMPGIPDLAIFYNSRYAFLEVKRSASEPFQPNQEYYLEILNDMSFAACIYPENEDEVLDALQRAFELDW